MESSPNQIRPPPLSLSLPSIMEMLTVVLAHLPNFTSCVLEQIIDDAQPCRRLYFNDGEGKEKKKKKS